MLQIIVSSFGLSPTVSQNEIMRPHFVAVNLEASWTLVPAGLFHGSIFCYFEMQPGLSRLKFTWRCSYGKSTARLPGVVCRKCMHAVYDAHPFSPSPLLMIID